MPRIEPGPEEKRPADGPAPGHGRDAQENRAEQGCRRDHHRAVRQPVEQARQRQGGDHGAAPEQAEGEGHVGLGTLQRPCTITTVLTMTIAPAAATARFRASNPRRRGVAR